ncbi:unnamed protein product, partial [Rhizoctonia solani]
ASNWLTFRFGDLNTSRVIRPGTGTGEILDTYWCMSGIRRCSGCTTFRNRDGGISAVFDWAESNWTSGAIGKYAFENTALENSKSSERARRLRIYIIFSWYRRLANARH